MIDPASGLVTAVVSLVKFLNETDRPARYRIKGSGMEFGTSAELYAELARRRELEEATAAPPEEPADPAAGPAEPAQPEPSPSPPPPPSPEEPIPAAPEIPLPGRPEFHGAPPLPVPRDDARIRPRGRPRRSDAIPELPVPSHILGHRYGPRVPRPRRPPKGATETRTPREILMDKIDDQVQVIIDRELKRRRERPEGFRPKGRTPSGGWSWETYRRDVERVLEDAARRRGAPIPRRRDTPVRTKRGAVMHPFPPPRIPEGDELEEAVDAVLERPEPMPPLPRTAESRGFGDIKHSFPRPAPEALPPHEPVITIPRPQVPAPQPIPVPGPVQTPTPSSATGPMPAAASAAMAALGVFVISRARARPKSQTRARSQTATPTQPATETFTPPRTVAPTPTPTPTPSPSSPPAPPLTPTNAPSAQSARAPRCKTPAEQRKDDRKRRKEKRKECKQFLSVRVPAHKRKMCIGDLAKYLYRKAQRTARAAIRKKIIAELEERGVNARELIKLTKKPRRKKAEVEIGGVEIDFEDLIGGK